MSINGIVMMILVCTFQAGAFGYLISLAVKKDSDADEAI